VRIGDLVRRVGNTPEEMSDYAELGVGIIIGTEGRPLIGTQRGVRRWGDDVDFIVMWPKHGIGWEYPDMLEVMT
jgi:hypothetical protein